MLSAFRQRHRTALPLAKCCQHLSKRCPLATLAPSLSMARPLRSPRQAQKCMRNGVSLARSHPPHFANTFACKRAGERISPTASHGSAVGEKLSPALKAVSARYARSLIIYGSSAPLPTPNAKVIAKWGVARTLAYTPFRKHFCSQTRCSHHFANGIAKLCLWQNDGHTS